MQVKKFEAPTLQEALDHVKRELGPEAIILQTRTHKGGFGLLSKGSVEVTAAVSDRSIAKKSFFEKKVPDKYKESVQKLPSNRQVDEYEKALDRHVDRAAKTTRDQVQIASKKITATRYIDIPEAQSSSAPPPKQAASLATPETAARAVRANIPKPAPLEEEVRYLKRMIEELKNTQQEPPAPSASSVSDRSVLSSVPLQEAYEQLLMNGVEKRIAYNILKRIAFELGDQQSKNPEKIMDSLCEEIMDGTAVHALLGDLAPTSGNASKGDPLIISFVGPTGVGKTTTLAKIASQAIYQKKLKVGMINLDCFKVGASDQMETYAKVLNVPFRTVNNVSDLRSALSDLKGMDLILMDTTGRSHRDTDSLRETQKIMESVPGIQCQLVISVTTRDTEMNDMVNRFSLFNPKGLIFTKLDEATIFGALLNVHQKFKLPLLYFTTGQRVPEDIEEATKERLAALVMDL